MMNYLKQNHLSFLIILWLVLSPAFLSAPAPVKEIPRQLGVRDLSTITNPQYFTEYVKIGTNGSTVNELKATTCDFITAGGASATFAASTTKVWDCAVTGVTATDIVFVSMPTTTPSTGTGVTVMANASSTAGFVTFRVSNGSGAAITLGPTTIGSSTQVLYIDN